MHSRNLKTWNIKNNADMSRAYKSHKERLFCQSVDSPILQLKASSTTNIVCNHDAP